MAYHEVGSLLIIHLPKKSNSNSIPIYTKFSFTINLMETTINEGLKRITFDGERIL